LAVLRKIALLAVEPEAVQVQFSMPYTRGCEFLEETHGSALAFGCEHDAIVMDRDILEMAIVGANAAAPVSPRPADAADLVAALVRDLLPYGHPRIEQVAAHLRVSVRTLQRRLRDWGFSFEELVDDIRRAEATRLVVERQYSAMEIAFLLGYSDQAHFTRAFKRWTGLPPRNYAKAADGVAI
jgi:AraC-like DNA-binding protein